MEAAKRVHVEKAQNFMRQFRDPESRELKKLTANQFMEVWSHYDVDCKFKILAQVIQTQTIMKTDNGTKLFIIHERTCQICLTY